MNLASQSVRIRRRGLAVIVGASVASLTLLLSACSTSGAPMIGATEKPVGVEQSAVSSKQTFNFTGQPQTLTVPDNVTHVSLSVRGGGGGGVQPSYIVQPGSGATITGELPVKAGDTIVLGVGDRGGNNNGNTAPGSGGWALAPEYQGGNGGSGHGSQTADGSGGGGASVVELNGQVVVVAAGGGGIGGRPDKLAFGAAGGIGGDSHGEDGTLDSFSGGSAGRGGSSSHPSNNPIGGSYSGALLEGGGGGGGGGFYRGGGGSPGTNGGAGGGGGSSLRGQLSDFNWSYGTSQVGQIVLQWITDGGKIGPTVQLTAPTSIRPNVTIAPFTVALPQDATGTVTFLDNVAGNIRDLGVVPVANGAAKLSQLDAILTSGDHDVYAVYGGDDQYEARTSNHVTVTVAQDVPTATLKIRGSSSSAVIVIDGSLVAPIVLTLPTDATGAVTFTYASYKDPIQGGTLGVAPLANGTATLSAVDTVLAKGEWTITASYTGDQGYTSAAFHSTIDVTK